MKIRNTLVVASLAVALALPTACASHCNPGNPTNLIQQNGDGSALGAGDTTSGAMDTDVILTADWVTVSGSVCGQDGTVEIELQESGTAFTNNPTNPGALVNPINNGTPVAVNIAGLTPGTAYHWQASNVTPSWCGGCRSGWAQFNGGADAFVINAAQAPAASTLSITALILAAMGAMLVFGRRSA